MKKAFLLVILCAVLSFTLHGRLQAQCYGDFNCDGVVDGADLALFADSYGSIGCSSWLGKIEGTVQCESGDPVVGATVYIPGDSFVSITDDDGLYLLRAVPDGLYNVIVRMQGREIVRHVDVEVVAGTTTLLDITTNLCGEEVCDGVDNDWDGAIDEDLVGELCELQAGVCAGSQKICGGLAGWLPCSLTTYMAYSPHYEQTEITCDGLDNDCDGLTDENLDRACGASSIGQCELGTQTCVDGQWGVCEGEIGPSAEVCDGIDNDCDGSTDEEVSCDDGLSCTTDSCDSGGCNNVLNQGFCVINGSCYSDGALNPQNECEFCEPSTDPYSWTHRPDGSGCTGGTCSGGTCQAP